MPGEQLRDALGVVAVPLHPHREGLHPAQGQPVVERAGHRADRVLGERQLLGQGVVAGHQGAADHVGVPAEVLGRGVQHDVRAEGERLLQVGRGEGVVDDEAHVRRARDVRERGDVRDAQQRVRRRLAPDDAGGGPQGRAQGVDVAEVDRGVLHAPRREHLVDQPERAAVGVVREHDVVAGGQEHPQQHVAGPHPGAERVGVPAALEGGEALLQRGAGGVGAARVLVATGPQPAHAVLGEGGRQVQRCDHRAGGRVGLLPGVDGPGGEALGKIAHDSTVRGGAVRTRGRPARPSGSPPPRACRPRAPARRPRPRTPTSRCPAARSRRSWAVAATCAAPAGPTAAPGR